MNKIILALLLMFSCMKTEVNPPCIGNCDSFMSLGVISNDKFHHYKLYGSYSYFPIYIEATDVNHIYQYNGTSVIEAWFDTSTYWELKDSLTITIPLYKGFGGLKAGPYWNSTPLSVKGKKVYLSQFAGYLVPIVQNDTRIYLTPYEANPYGFTSDYKPKEGNLWGKRIVGPIPIEMKGDTITIYSKVIWEKSEKIDSIKIILD